MLSTSAAKSPALLGYLAARNIHDTDVLLRPAAVHLGAGHPRHAHGGSPGTRELTGLLPAVDLLGVDTDAAALRAGLKLMFEQPRPATGGYGR